MENTIFCYHKNSSNTKSGIFYFIDFCGDYCYIIVCNNNYLIFTPSIIIIIKFIRDIKEAWSVFYIQSFDHRNQKLGGEKAWGKWLSYSLFVFPLKKKLADIPVQLIASSVIKLLKICIGHHPFTLMEGTFPHLIGSYKVQRCSIDLLGGLTVYAGKKILLYYFYVVPEKKLKLEKIIPTCYRHKSSYCTLILLNN